MSTDAKSYAKTVLDGYNDTLKLLEKRYNTAIAVIDSEHDLERNRIKKESIQKKSSVDAVNKTSLHNTKAQLLDKGLSNSGESVQADIDHNLAKNYAFAEIEREANDRKAENERSRANAKASALSDYIDSVVETETTRNSEYMKQLNADREYEADRDDEKHARYVDTRDFEAERSDEIYDRYADNRDYVASRNDEAYDRYADNRDYEAGRSDEVYDRFADNRDYESNSKTSEKSSSSKAEDTGDEDIGLEMDITPHALVDKVRLVYNSKSFSSDSKRQDAIKAALDTVIKDTTLSEEYRQQVKVYAKSLGLY